MTRILGLKNTFWILPAECLHITVMSLRLIFIPASRTSKICHRMGSFESVSNLVLHDTKAIMNEITGI